MARVELGQKIENAFLYFFGVDRRFTQTREERIQAMADFFSQAEENIQIVANGKELDEIAEALERAGIESTRGIIDNLE